MAPPQLTGNTPVLNVIHPLVVGFIPVLGHKTDLSAFYRINSRLGQLFDCYVPLIGEVRFNNRAGAITTGHFKFVVVNFNQNAIGFELCNNCLTRIKAVQPLIGFRGFVVNFGIRGEDIDHRQAMTLTHVVIVEIMRWRNLNAAGTKFRIHIIISNDRD